MTTDFAQGIARVLHLGSVENVIEYVVRAVSFGYLFETLLCRCVVLKTPSCDGATFANVAQIFFGLNLIFNGVMWGLFTQALARGNSTTQVSIMNTSANFVITAFAGFLIFSESLPPLWWVGATLLVAGNVIIGSQDESGKPGGDEEHATRPPGQDGLGTYEDVPQAEGIIDPELKDEDEDIVELGDLGEPED